MAPHSTGIDGFLLFSPFMDIGAIIVSGIHIFGKYCGADYYF